MMPVVQRLVCLAMCGMLLACSRTSDDAEWLFRHGKYGVALPLWRERAEHGDPAAQNYLGAHYQLGLAVAQDYKKAAHWYTLAAENGNADAQRNLGAMYYSGNGVSKNIGLAYAWYVIAAKNGNTTADEARNSLTAEMASGDSRVYEQQMRTFLLRKGILNRVLPNASIGDN